MNTELVISILLSIIGFLLIGIYNDIKKIGRNVDQLMINEAAHKERLEDYERRITHIEHLKKAYGKG